jgi:hypothetical protein
MSGGRVLPEAITQVGYGIPAFGLSPLLDGGVELATIYAVCTIIVAGMGLVSLAVTRPRTRTPERVHVWAIAARR